MQNSSFRVNTSESSEVSEVGGNGGEHIHCSEHTLANC